MLIAQKLIKENIAEYILYMFNVEDIIRAYALDIDKIERDLIAAYNVPDTERHKIKEWYESLIDMMRSENVQQSGHIQLIKNILSDLEDMHKYLLETGKDVAYNAKFYHILPSITVLKGKTTDPTVPDIEMCFIFLYGIINLRRTHKEISQATQQTADETGKFMVLLSKNYIKWKNNGFDNE